MTVKIIPFWDRVDKSGGPDACWPWMGSRSRHGYGRLANKAVSHTSAHRAALAYAVAVPFDGACALHKCDNPPCCNPTHLYWGTKADNARDRDARHRRAPPRATLHGNFIDRAGHRFGRLVVLGIMPIDAVGTRWSCLCDCGKDVVVSGRRLFVGGTESCGCRRTDGVRRAYAKKVAGGTTDKGEANHSAKLTDAKVVEIRRRLAAGDLPVPLGAEFGVTAGAIRHIRDGRSWTHVTALAVAVPVNEGEGT